ncbi:MAG: histidine kinase [Flavobacteriales bacterium]|nr:histidine kinase [Flavobacteriales bacterium]MDW8410910.1 histidine kinase [Flavobacteriales bacterium]
MTKFLNTFWDIGIFDGLQWSHGVIVILLVVVLTQWCAYSDLKSKYKNLTRKNLLQRKEIKTLKIESLRHKLQPHTINNALHLINIRLNNLQKSVDAFADVTEYVVYARDDKRVSIKEEVDFVKDYIRFLSSLQNCQECLKMDFQIDEKSAFYLEPCLPPLLLAPLIENAFEHGDTKNPEFLNIVVRLQGDTFIFRIQNIISSKKMSSSKGGLGLQILKDRLEYLVGNRASLEFSNKDNIYTAELKIKLEFDRKQEKQK